MPTAKKRINISVSKTLEDILNSLAKRDEVPVSTKVVELLGLAIEIQEDFILGEMAHERDTKNAKYISHEDAWS